MRLLRPSPTRRRGLVAVVVAIALTFLIGMAALTLEGGALEMELRKVRAAADAAAMAGACDLFKHYPRNQGKDYGTATAAALDMANTNGFPNDTTHSTVVAYSPPKTGIYAGQYGYIEVVITKNMDRQFSRIWGTAPIPVSARAVARGAWVWANAGVIILDYDDKASLNDQGNGAVTETGGPVIVNSNNPSALVTTGNGKMTAPEFDITGGVKVSGGASLFTQPVAGQVFTGVHPTPDPLSYLPAPAVPPDGTMTKLSLLKGNTQYTLTPGRYTNLPTFNTGDVVILQQASANNAGGIYYIDGGGFKSTGATIIMDPLTTGGVMLYNKPASSASSQKIQITGNDSGIVQLTPLTSGPYEGMMLWQDRTSAVDVLVEGNGKFSVQGTFYAAGARLNINGNGTTTTGYGLDARGNWVPGPSQIGSQYISNNLSLGGNGNITIYYNGPDKARTRIITLVE
jgi:Putative Flp pilus-assembly TadE/G-like